MGKLSLSLLLPLLLAAAAAAGSRAEIGFIRSPSARTAPASARCIGLGQRRAFVPAPCVRRDPPVSARRASRTRGVLCASEKDTHAQLDTAVVIVPGYATDASLYEPLQASMRRRGIPTWVVPIKWYMWAPTFGGRSIRPILDRIHETVLSVALKDRELPADSTQDGTRIEYGWTEFAHEMKDPSVGAQPHEAYQFPPHQQPFPASERRFKISLVAHSAGGWLSRIYLSSCEYSHSRYNGARFVDTLVTLGSPHVFPDKYVATAADSVPIVLRNLKFVHECCSGDWEGRVRVVCVGSDTVKATGGWFKNIAGQSYELCGYPEEGVTGDGITPLASALGMPNATHVQIQGAMHGPDAEVKGEVWYGTDPSPLEDWLPYVTGAEGPIRSAIAESAIGDCAEKHRAKAAAKGAR